MTSTARREATAVHDRGRSWLPEVDATFRPRPRVLRALDDAKRVVVVTAPGGYGKTSNVAAWARTSQRPVVWVDLGRESNDPATLLQSVVSALATQRGLDTSRLPPIRGAAAHVCANVLPHITSWLTSADESLVLVLDEVQHVSSTSAVQVLEAVSQRLPSGSTIVLIGRSVPATMLARLRVMPGFTEIQAEALALDLPSANSLLDRLRPTRAFDSDAVAGLVERSEGWPIAMLIAATRTDLDSDPAWEDVITDHVLTDYVLQEWLAQMPADDVEFLMRASTLEVMDIDACDHVTEIERSGAVLRRIVADRSLVIPIDRRHQQFRLHPLLRTALQDEAHRQNAADWRDRHRRAAEWFAARGQSDAAVHHALATGDRDLAIDIVLEHAPRVHAAGRVETVATWVAALDDHSEAPDPRLCLVAAFNSWGLFATRETVVWADMGLSTVRRRGDEESDLRWQIEAWRSLVLPTIDLAAAERAYAAVTPGRWHVIAGIALAGHLHLSGNSLRACHVLEEVIPEARLAGLVTSEAAAMSTLAIILEHCGDATRWPGFARGAKDIVDRAQIQHMPSAVMAHTASALLAASVGDLTVSHRDWSAARHGLALMGDGGGLLTLVVRLTLASVALLHGDRAAARMLAIEARRQMTHLRGATGATATLASIEDRLDRSSQILAFGASSISTAELRVLHHLPSNLTLGEIGERIHVSRNTVKSHTLSIYRKLEVDSRRAAVDVARATGLLPAAADIAAIPSGGVLTSR